MVSLSETELAEVKELISSMIANLADAQEFTCSLIVSIFGDNNGTAFEITPELPTMFSTNINIDGIAYNVDFLKVETSSNGLVCWFIDKEDDTFFVTLRSLFDSNPLLYSAIVTYLFMYIN